jgi:hypothetical protein
MSERQIEPDALGEDWEGNNAAFTCPLCAKVFLVSGRLHPHGRDCPGCGKSRGHIAGGRKSGGKAWISHDDSV